MVGGILIIFNTLQPVLLIYLQDYFVDDYSRDKVIGLEFESLVVSMSFKTSSKYK